MKKEEPVTILLSRHERDLISKHGYPFEGIEAQLNRAGNADLLRVTDNPFWWERVIVNLHIPETEPEKAEVATPLRNLIDRIAKELKLRMSAAL